MLVKVSITVAVIIDLKVAETSHRENKLDFCLCYSKN